MVSSRCSQTLGSRPGAPVLAFFGFSICVDAPPQRISGCGQWPDIDGLEGKRQLRAARICRAPQPGSIVHEKVIWARARFRMQQATQA
jgi:hypothetical protein